jgi:hypothetical protein
MTLSLNSAWDKKREELKITRHEMRQRVAALRAKPVLDGEILSFNPAKLAQLLPERRHEDRAAGSSAWIQITYADDFPCLLRVGGRAKRKEHGAKSKDRDFFLHAF